VELSNGRISEMHHNFQRTHTEIQEKIGNTM